MIQSDLVTKSVAFYIANMLFSFRESSLQMEIRFNQRLLTGSSRQKPKYYGVVFLFSNGSIKSW